MGVSFSLWVASATSQAQTAGRGGSFSPSGSLGSRGVVSGGRGVRTRAINPNFNPPGALSTFQQLNPPGSTGPALNLNPEGSVFRPRSHTDSSQPSTVVRSPSRYETYSPALVPTHAQLELMSPQNLRVWVRLSAHQLEDELARFENGSDWKMALQIDQVREILRTERLHLSDEEQQRLRATLVRLNKLATDSRYDAVTQLPGFTPLRSSLAQLLSADACNGRTPNAQQNEITSVETPRN